MQQLWSVTDFEHDDNLKEYQQEIKWVGNGFSHDKIIRFWFPAFIF